MAADVSASAWNSAANVMRGSVKSTSPFLIGMESAKANAVPMVVLWIAAVVTAVAYYAVPGVAGLLEPLAKWQRDNGAVAAFLSLAVFCGVIPGVFICSIRSLRPRHPLATVFAMSVWCGLWGIVNNEMYAFLSRWLGDGRDIGTLVMKTAFDQFVWTVLAVAPANATFCFWLGRDFSFRRTRNEWPDDYVRTVFFPNLLANWIVWIPVLCAVFAFPLPLQIQLAGLASSFWALMCLQIGRRSAVFERHGGRMP